MFYDEAMIRLQKEWDIVLSDDEVSELVVQFKDIAPDDLPEQYNGLTSEDLFNILLFFDGERGEYPDIFMFMLAYRPDGMPKFGLSVPD
jgi:hypothetical protein